jgi:CDP-glucose 4,6-dehydratase
MVNPSPVFWNGKRVLLTGHTGFKGAWCALWLKALGAAVFGLALEPATRPALHELLGTEFGPDAIGDVRDPRDIDRAFERAKPEIIIHMAAQALVHSSYKYPADTFDTNVMGLVRLLEAARKAGSVRSVVNVTSDKCYENNDQIWAYRETEPMGGADPYSASKGCAELVTASYRRSFFNDPNGPFLASGRAGNVIGGGDWSPDRLVPDCIRAFNADRILLIRNPLATRPWQHVLEPVCGYLVLAQVLYEQGHNVAQGWNFGPTDSDAWPVGRVVQRIADLWGETAAWSVDQTVWRKEAMLLRVDATKARLGLGWRPRLGIQDALSWTIDWYKEVRNGRSALDITTEQISRYEAMTEGLR